MFLLNKQTSRVKSLPLVFKSTETTWSLEVEPLLWSTSFVREWNLVVSEDGSKEKMLGSTEDASSGSTQSDGATSAHQRECYCGRPMIMRTAHTDQNYGHRFVSCENWKVSY
ncbi:hypothetical protein SLA2020_337810 [Shorea laevis]